ncbi:metal-dependent hydrolase [Aureibaculum sp. 2210JD6-5]|uniref:metal-dependent hydrolase n=1 Tax=Aureibaculum sp. 2210JD6-5 TaxID=3103957 RepID=UPI002AAF03C0|nr:metal-dependent hydrolase [Aureibaculum sp. 2210JD6-5]MDY7394051.1 metal-dependent hydrolase [Aureibaculum sp. 2210JD6-5]
MTAPNHIAGGIVITGIFASLWNVNIFANPLYISLTIIGSLIPDIDHTKSIIGKLVYPLARWISIKFGHRTITHSIGFITFLTVTMYMLEHFQFFGLEGHSASLILFFSVFSHYLLDMATIQGIPLFYPIYRNPCVIPANVDLRITTGNLKQEGIALFIFALMVFFLQDLFQNGFWFTYNKKFNDIAHLEREFKNSNTLLKVNYDFDLFQNNYTSSGFLVYADFEKCIILSDTLITLDIYRQGQLIHKLEPVKTKDVLTVNTSNFSNITVDSINKILANKFISQGKIFANKSIDLVTKDDLKSSMYFDLKNEYNLHYIESIKDSLNNNKFSELQELEYKIKLEEDALSHGNSRYYKAMNRLKKLNAKLQNSTSLTGYDINEIKNEIIKLESFTAGFTPKRSKTLIKLQDQLEAVKNRKISTDIFVSGTINYFHLPEKNKNTIASSN